MRRVVGCRGCEGHAVQWGLCQKAGLAGKEECAWKAQQHGAGICKERGFRESLAFEWGKRAGGVVLPERRERPRKVGWGLPCGWQHPFAPFGHRWGSSRWCGAAGEGLSRGQGGDSRLWAEVENDPAWRDLFLLPGSSIPGKMLGRRVAARNICCLVLGWCQPTSHLWQ